MGHELDELIVHFKGIGSFVNLYPFGTLKRFLLNDFLSIFFNVVVVVMPIAVVTVFTGKPSLPEMPAILICLNRGFFLKTLFHFFANLFEFLISFYLL